MQQQLEIILREYQHQFRPVIPFTPDQDKMVQINLGKNNDALQEEVYKNTDGFSAYINQQLESSGANYVIGGYLENRNVYKRSALFETLKPAHQNLESVPVAGSSFAEIPEKTTKQRTFHLGMDVWGAVGTPIFAPIEGTIHSFAFNNQFGDYGATIILKHQLDGLVFHTLYGHLSKADLAIDELQEINAGELIGHFGPPAENGHWPPHLHFQIIIDMEFKKGDYPGVCHFNDLDFYKNNCPDPDLILKLSSWAQQ